MLIQLSLKFYEDNNNSKLCLGKKGPCQHIWHGIKTNKTGMPVFTNLNTLHIAFKAKHLTKFMNT